jgi:transposase InsO family protein
VEENYSWKISAHDVKPGEPSFSLPDILEMGLENARKESHLSGNEAMPRPYSDNGPGFTSKLLTDYLSKHGIKHIFGVPYHPQGWGKIERFKRRIKEKLFLEVCCSPDELKRGEMGDCQIRTNRGLKKGRRRKWGLVD